MPYMLHEVKIKKPAKEISKAGYSQRTLARINLNVSCCPAVPESGPDRKIEFILLSVKQHNEANRLILKPIVCQIQISG
jgi:hypothetical protein